jgi:uncharacterized protein (DUF1499 family)
MLAPKEIRVRLIITLLVLIALWIAIRVWAASAPRPRNLGLKDGQLAPCPKTPNCVSSQAGDGTHAIEPIQHGLTRDVARARLLDILRADRRATIITEEPEYIHAEFRVPFFAFIDDVELVITDDVIHVRSASRLGGSDLGVNRKRVQEIARAFESAGGGNTH